MRIRTDEKPHRKELIEDTAELFDCNQTEGILRACEHAQMDARAKAKTIEWATKELEPDKAAKLASLLSTLHISIEYQPPEGRTEIP